MKIPILVWGYFTHMHFHTHVKPVSKGQSGLWMSHFDWLLALLAMAGDEEVKEKLLQGYKIGDKTFKVHVDA